MARGRDRRHKDPDLRYAPASWRKKTWPTFTEDIVEEPRHRSAPGAPEVCRARAGDRRAPPARRRPFLAGTDTPAGVDVIPGPSLHHELERFVAAGFTPLEALRTATILPAEFLGKTAELGTVEKGKIADLVLLDANPLEDVRNTRRIAAVVSEGRLLSRQELDRILAGVEAYAKAH